MTNRCLRTLAAVAVALTLAGLCVQLPVETRQAPDAVYPVYDGYVKNQDGSLTLSFAYFNHNRTPVTIPVGPDNSFMPGPVERGQTTTFLSGHHRWQCIMVVGPDFDGNLRWNVAHGATRTTTSESMLQYSWELDVASTRQVLRGVDLDTAPRDVCINRPPIVRVLGVGGRRGPQELTVAVGAELKLFGSVRDEGLPRDAALTATWRAVSGPGTVTFERADQARTRAVFSVPGTYELELSGSDSVFDSTTRVPVIVNPL